MRVYKAIEIRLLNQLNQLDNELLQLKEVSERQQDRLRSLQREKVHDFFLRRQHDLIFSVLQILN